MSDTLEKIKSLKKYMGEKSKSGICLAFSGGVDSSLILDIGCEEAKKNGGRLVAVTFSTRLHPKSDIEIAKKLCEERGISHIVLDVDESESKELLNNPVNRCYICKKHIFETLLSFAKSNNLSVCMEGTNFDDLKSYRPGIKAIDELGIESPLRKFELTKNEIRSIAESRGISVSKRPSAPCLATRIPYNTPMDFDLFERIEKGENQLKSMGFKNIRIRVHQNIARIEIDKENFKDFIEKGDIIVEKIKGLGFEYVTLDIEGFRSGSMDININKE